MLCVVCCLLLVCLFACCFPRREVAEMIEQQLDQDMHEGVSALSLDRQKVLATVGRCRGIVRGGGNMCVNACML